MSTDTPPNIYNEATQQWKSARDLLNHAIDDFLSASAHLCDVLSLPSNSPASHRSLDQVLTSVNTELVSLSLDEKRLEKMRLTLATKRNGSQTFVPVHRLPPEVLSTILGITCARLTSGDVGRLDQKRSSPAILMQVCSIWQSIVMNTPAAWSHIDIVANHQSPHAAYRIPRLWAERSQNSLLYIDVWDKAKDYSDKDRALTAAEVLDLVGFLTPLMPRVCVLNIGLNHGPAEMITDLMENWVLHHSPALQKSLYIYDRWPNNDDPYVWGPAPEGLIPENDFDRFFRSVTRLVLQNCRVAQNLTAHTGLVELELKHIDQPYAVTQHTLAAVLSTSPNLEKLVLLNCWVEQSPVTPGPATLDHLGHLTLESAEESDNLAHVLPLLSVGSDSFDMCLTLSRDPDFVTAAHSFFGRSKVSRLCARACEYDGELWSPAALCCQHSHLEELFTDSLDMSGEAFSRFVSANPTSETLALWPKLQTWYLNNSKINVDLLRKLVQRLPSLETLYWFDLLDENTGEEISEKRYGRLKALLLSVAPGLWIENEGPPWEWDVIVLK